jgi:hypothetical protein
MRSKEPPPAPTSLEESIQLESRGELFSIFLRAELIRVVWTLRVIA